ncbi:NAD(P)H-dependent flavin oxidoreductase [Oceanospirillum sanctuarii]|uniref:NAD(P)H-dependent flavin oxidoreductase n=1 Tax=Oceanospirillum sanctuarii TaxID=1434821 RepID=UPI000A3A5305|nr:nitronate monooxygenase [Oceanospirillum sanctuarii]
MSEQIQTRTPQALFQSLQYPIFQAPMAGSQDSVLAIAVSDSGGLGALPCAMLSVEQVAEQLELIRAKQGRAINLNFFSHTPPEPSDEDQKRWLDTLAPYFNELDVDPASVASGAGRQPFSRDYLDAIAPFKPEVVSFHFGLPDKSLMTEIKAWGGLIASSATTLAEGLWLQDQGADLVIAQGLEAGGHRGHFLRADLEEQLPTRELVKGLVQQLDIPVVAAGGISTPQQVSEMLELGASAVQIGTGFLLTPEAKTSALHRSALKSEMTQNTAITNLFSGRPARGMVNRLMAEQGPMSDKTPAFPLATNGIAPLRAAAEKQGSWDFSPLWAGTGAAECQEKSVTELISWFAGASPL